MSPSNELWKYVLHFGLLGGFVGTLIFAPFLMPEHFGHYNIKILLFLSSIGFFFMGIPVATITGSIFGWFYRRGLADNYRQRGWWLACFAGASVPFAIKMIISFSSGNYLWLSHWVGLAALLLISTAVTAGVYNLIIERRQIVATAWIFALIVWFVGYPFLLGKLHLFN